MQQRRLSSGASSMASVPAPQDHIFRVARGRDPFGAPPWEKALEDGTFGNRFDDPSGRWGRGPSDRYRVIYCASKLVTAFAEVISRFRPSLPTLAAIDHEVTDADEEPLEHIERQQVIIDQRWQERRRVGKTLLDPTLRFVDMAAAETIAYMRYALAPQAKMLGLDDVDLSIVTGPNRHLTQEASRHIYESTDDDGNALYAGIRYISRLGANWECWALFHDRIEGLHTPSPPENIHCDTESLVRAAEIYGCHVEEFNLVRRHMAR